MVKTSVGLVYLLASLLEPFMPSFSVAVIHLVAFFFFPFLVGQKIVHCCFFFNSFESFDVSEVFLVP